MGGKTAAVAEVTSTVTSRLVEVEDCTAVQAATCKRAMSCTELLGLMASALALLL